MVLSKELLELWIPLLRDLDQAYSDFGKELVDAIVKRLDVKEGKRFIMMNNSVIDHDIEYRISNELSYIVSEPLVGYILICICWMLTCRYRMMHQQMMILLAPATC